MSKANDPFNFDDLYKQAGVDNLFVKKSMAEQKAMASRPGAATPTRPAAATGVASFGSSPTRNAGITQPIQQPSPNRGLAAAASNSSSTNSLKGMDLDPFAGLSSLSKPPPMSASKSSPPYMPSSARPPTPSNLNPSQSQPPAAGAATQAAPVPVPPGRPAAAAAVAGGFDLENMFGPRASSPAQQQQQAPTTTAAPAAASTHADDDPFAAFGTVEGAAAAVPATPPPPAAAAAAAPQPEAGPKQPSGQATPAREQQPAAHEAEPRPASAYFAQLDQQQQQREQQPRHPEPDGRYSSTSNSSRYKAYADNPSSFSSSAPPAAGSYADRYGGNHNSAAYDFGHAGYSESASGGGAGKGWGGLFKSVTKTAATLGKKGLKAAQAGLAQLESAIENLDKPAGAGGSSTGAAGPEADYDLPAERVLSIAIHISELPSSRQEESLARLPRPVRQKVLALLREQAVIEGEEQLQQQSSAAGADAGVIHTREFDLSDQVQPSPPPTAAAAAAVRDSGSSQLASSGRATPTAPATAAVQPPASAAAVPATKAAATPAPQVPEEDLLGMSAAAAPAAAAAAAPPAPNVASVADIDDFFSGGTPAASSPARSSPAAATAPSPGPRPRSAGPSGSAANSSSMSRVLSNSDGHLADLLGGAGSNAAAAARASKSSNTMNLGGLEALGVDVGANGDLYEDNHADSNEPEIRRQLRAARAAEKHAKMKAALAEQQAKEAAEQERRQQQQAHKQAHKERIEAWKNKNKGNVRGLLGSLQTVLWEDSGWKPIGMADLLEPAQVRKAWMKANLLVHPDKVRQRNGGDEQVAIADMIFDALKEAWGQFRV